MPSVGFCTLLVSGLRRSPFCFNLHAQILHSPAVVQSETVVCFLELCSSHCSHSSFEAVLLVSLSLYPHPKMRPKNFPKMRIKSEIYSPFLTPWYFCLLRDINPACLDNFPSIVFISCLFDLIAVCGQNFDGISNE